jgi:hypothetical protein
MRWLVLALVAGCADLEAPSEPVVGAVEALSFDGAFGGIYQLGDAGCASCVVANPLTGGCSCPASFVARSGVRVLADCGPGGAPGGTSIVYCTAPVPPIAWSTPPPLALYQRDDVGPGSEGCRTPNYLTGDCSCPPQMRHDVYRTVRPNATGGIGATLGVCQYVEPAGEAAFTGAYHDEDGLEGCILNPFSSRCDCPPLASKQELRALYDPPGGLRGATIGVCSPCRRRSCSELGVSSGVVADGCGGELDCGSACTTSCAQVGATCGVISDGCGGTLDCGPVGPGCVTPTACPSGSAVSDLRGSSQIPRTAAIGSRIRASVTFANCSGATWTPASPSAATGHKLGFDAPADRALFGDARLRLPASVPTGHAVTVPIDVGAPPLVGPQRFAWRVLLEGTAWLGESSVTRVIRVVAPESRRIALCPGVSADPTGLSDASAALQDCVDRTPDYGVLRLPFGVFRIDERVNVERPMTITSATTSAFPCLHPDGRCPVLLASERTEVEHGFLYFFGHDIALDRVVIDGNRAARAGSGAAHRCFEGQGAYGVNASWLCDQCSMTNSASVRGLCGTSISFDGGDARFLVNSFVDNGTSLYHNLWSDGLGLGHVPRAHVRGNYFFDNTDASLIAGRGENAVFELNTVIQREKLVFTALMLTNYAGVESGDFRGAFLRNNAVDCGNRSCDFGLQIGHHSAVSGTPNTLGGNVYGNAIWYARQGVNVEGGGTPAAPVRIHGNTVYGAAPRGNFSCGDRDTSALNYSPDSTVDRAGESTPATARTWHDCI